MIHSWITAADLADPTNVDAPYAAEAASWILYKLSAEKFPGLSTTTELYISSTVENDALCASLALEPVWATGTLAGLESRVLTSSYGGSRPRSLRLRQPNVRSVSAVAEAGSALDPDLYSLRNGAYLVRGDALGWDIRRGVLVTYTYGALPPEAGKRAAVVFANELVKLAAGDEECRLPERVTSVSRQGISFTVMDPNDFIKDDRVGLYEVDLFLRAVNPLGSRKIARVFSPDRPRGERSIPPW